MTEPTYQSPDTATMAALATVIGYAKSDMSDADARAAIIKQGEKYKSTLDEHDQFAFFGGVVTATAFADLTAKHRKAQEEKARVPLEAETQPRGTNLAVPDSFSGS